MGLTPAQGIRFTSTRRSGLKPQLVCRAINEHIRYLSESYGFEGEIDLICECTRPACFEHLRVSPETHEAARRVPNRFLLKPGHTDPHNERVIEETDRYTIIEKIGFEARQADRDDPRR